MTNANLGLRWKCLEVKFDVFQILRVPRAFLFSRIMLCDGYIISNTHASRRKKLYISVIVIRQSRLLWLLCDA